MNNGNQFCPAWKLSSLEKKERKESEVKSMFCIKDTNNNTISKLT